MGIDVIGSVNRDCFIETDRFPKSRETVWGKSFLMSFAGEGAMNSASKKYRNKLIIICGGNGVKYFGEKISTIPMISVAPVDTTGAGDAFYGAVAGAEKKSYVTASCVGM